MIDLRAERLALGLTQREFARRCHCVAPYICAIEHGRETPSSGFLKVIEKVLGGEIVEVEHRRYRKPHGVIPFRDADEEAELDAIWRKHWVYKGTDKRGVVV